MQKAITIKYELKDAKTNEILESNFDGEAISFISEFNQILEKLEEEIVDMKDGEEKIVKISASEGVGEYKPENVQTLPIEQFAGIDLQVGMELFGESESGETARVIVKEITKDSISVDFNHPYAGKDLEFKIKMIENREATADEILNRGVARPHSCGCGHHHHEDSHECCGGHGHHHDKDHECCGGHHHGKGECCEDDEFDDESGCCCGGDHR